MTIPNELIDELLAGQDPSSVMRQDGLLGELKKALLNRLMAAEFDHHVAQERISPRMVCCTSWARDPSRFGPHPTCITALITQKSRPEIGTPMLGYTPA
jgi:hypothetical protein